MIHCGVVDDVGMEWNAPWQRKETSRNAERDCGTSASNVSTYDNPRSSCERIPTGGMAIALQQELSWSTVHLAYLRIEYKGNTYDAGLNRSRPQQFVGTRMIQWVHIARLRSVPPREAQITAFQCERRKRCTISDAGPLKSHCTSWSRKMLHAGCRPVMVLVGSTSLCRREKCAGHHRLALKGVSDWTPVSRFLL